LTHGGSQWRILYKCDKNLGSVMARKSRISIDCFSKILYQEISYWTIYNTLEKASIEPR
jgi:hypothetical protein